LDDTRGAQRIGHQNRAQGMNRGVWGEDQPPSVPGEVENSTTRGVGSRSRYFREGAEIVVPTEGGGRRNVKRSQPTARIGGEGEGGSRGESFPQRGRAGVEGFRRLQGNAEIGGVKRLYELKKGIIVFNQAGG